MDLEAGATVFVPLCGKSTDMIWLLDQGYLVLGSELSATACEQFFSDNGMEFKTRIEGNFTVFEGEGKGQGITILAGDVFDLDRNALFRVSGVFDRAALVALPSDMRRRYADHLIEILPDQVRILLITMEYDERKMQGPPFSVSELEVRSLFDNEFRVEIISESSGEHIVGNLKDRGLDDLSEQVILLVR